MRIFDAEPEIVKDLKDESEILGQKDGPRLHGCHCPPSHLGQACDRRRPRRLRGGGCDR